VGNVNEKGPRDVVDVSWVIGKLSISFLTNYKLNYNRDDDVDGQQQQQTSGNANEKAKKKRQKAQEMSTTSLGP
jgi:hypothetical protein